MAWSANESINLLNVVDKWELQMKDTQMRGKAKTKWQWVAAQLFVPKDEADLCRLSKRCERRVNLLRNNYEAYCLLALAEQNPAMTPPPPSKVDAELWKRMKSFFSAPKSLKEIKSPKMAVARVLAASVKKTLKEDEESSGSEDELQSNEVGLQKLQLHEDSFSSSSSSVGSNNLYHDSPLASSPTASSRSSYYEICSYDSYGQNSDGSGRTPGRQQNYRPLWKDIDYWPEGSLSKSPSSSYDVTESNSESSSKDIDDHVAHDQMLAVERALTIRKFSPCSEPKTTSSQVEFKSLIDFDDVDDPVPPVPGSGVISSAAAAAAETVLNTLSPLLTALKIPSATAAVEVTPAAAAPCPVLVECGRISPSNSKHSLGSNASGKSSSKKRGEKKDSNSGVSPATGFKSLKETPGASSKSASGEAAAKTKLDHSLSSSPRTSREVLICNNQNLSHHLQRLPTIAGSKSEENLPNADEDADGDRTVVSDEDGKKLLNDDEPLQSSKSKSSSSKERNESHDGETGSRKSSSRSPSSSSSFSPQLPVSGPDISMSNPGANAKDDNVNVMVYIKLNNLKISEGSHG